MINLLKKLFGASTPSDPETPATTPALEKEEKGSAPKPDQPIKTKPDTNEELKVLLKGLAHDDWQYRHEIGMKLAKIGSEAIEPLIEIVQNIDKGIEERKSAVFVLGEIGDKKAAEVLIAIINDYWPNCEDRFGQREQNRIKQGLTEDMHYGLAAETKDALLKIGFEVNFD